MIDYPKMYALLCGAIDDVLDELYNIPETTTIAEKLTSALQQAEEICIQTS